MLQCPSRSVFTLTISSLVAGVTLAAACAPPMPAQAQASAQAPPVVQIAPSPPPSPSWFSERISVAAVRPPPKLVLDGDVREWGSLLPPKPEPNAKGTPAEAADTAPRRWPPLDPGAPAKRTAARAKASAAARAKGQTEDQAREAAEAVEQEDAAAQALLEGSSGPPPDLSTTGSHLVLALTSDAALIAAELAIPAPDGIWLGVGSLLPDLPVPGELALSDTAFVELKCTGFVREILDGNSGNTAEINPPEALAACRKVMDVYAATRIAHEARFTKLFKIDRARAHSVGADGKLTPIASAKVAWKQGAKGTTVEVALPLAALPRVAEAPLTQLALVARVATTPAPPPELGTERWSLVGFPDAVSFEPHGALRAGVWKAVYGPSRSVEFRPPPGLSYQPGEALKVASARVEGDTLRSVEETLYTKEATLGDVEVGHVRSSSEFLAILKNGKAVDVVATPGSPRGVIVRDGELHVLAYTEASWRGAGRGYWLPPSWSVLVVAPDGRSREGVEAVKDTSPYSTCTYASDSPTEILSKGLDSFGVHADCTDGGGDYDLYVPVEALFRWDPARKKYTGGQWRVVAPPPKGIVAPPLPKAIVAPPKAK
jgi:hypothetical protein